MIEHLNPNEEQSRGQSDEIDEKIKELDIKAQSSSGHQKQEYLNKIRELVLKKSGSFEDKDKGFMGKFGL
jgi:ABC-type Zn uptake system ZnuABC Zn-binding protein ZnuA